MEAWAEGMTAPVSVPFGRHLRQMFDPSRTTRAASRRISFGLSLLTNSSRDMVAYGTETFRGA